MKKNKESASPKNIKKIKIIEEDGQSEKLEEKKIKISKVIKPLFGKDVNDPSERGHD